MLNRFSTKRSIRTGAGSGGSKPCCSNSSWQILSKSSGLKNGFSMNEPVCVGKFFTVSCFVGSGTGVDPPDQRRPRQLCAAQTPSPDCWRPSAATREPVLSHRAFEARQASYPTRAPASPVPRQMDAAVRVQRRRGRAPIPLVSWQVLEPTDPSLPFAPECTHLVFSRRVRRKLTLSWFPVQGVPEGESSDVPATGGASLRSLRAGPDSRCNHDSAPVCNPRSGLYRSVVCGPTFTVMSTVESRVGISVVGLRKRAARDPPSRPR